MARDIVGLKINADLLDGLSASDFAQVSGSATFSGSVTATDLVVDDDGTIGSATTPGAITVASGGNVTLTDNLVFASGQGIDFSATSDAAGSTSELLDDYEEGTWTPVLGDSSNDATMVTQNATYTKIGNQVFGQCDMSISSLGSISGDLRVKGLPFAAAAATSGFGSISVGIAENLAITSGQSVTGVVAGNNSFIVLKVFDATTGNTNMQGSEFSSDGRITFAFQYAV